MIANATEGQVLAIRFFSTAATATWSFHFPGSIFQGGLGEGEFGISGNSEYDYVSMIFIGGLNGWLMTTFNAGMVVAA